jgi:mRNA interferase RelE/StbE
MYSIRIKHKARKQLAMLPAAAANRIAHAIDALAHNPYPAGIKKLQGYDNVYRIRVGDYRILYSIENEILTIDIIKIAHRQSAYK